MKQRRLVGVGAVFCLFFGILVAVDVVGEVTQLPEPVKVGVGKRTVVNKIVARVNGVNLLLSDLKQPRLDTLAGRPYSLKTCSKTGNAPVSLTDSRPSQAKR